VIFRVYVNLPEGISYIQILAISFATDRHVLEGMFFLDNYLSNCFPDATHAFGQKKTVLFLFDQPIHKSIVPFKKMDPSDLC
jgi:hypothetical protein